MNSPDLENHPQKEAGYGKNADQIQYQNMADNTIGIPQTLVDKIIDLVKRVRRIIWWFLIAFPLSIVVATIRFKYQHVHSSGVSMYGLFVWISVIWIGLLVSIYASAGIALISRRVYTKIKPQNVFGSLIIFIAPWIFPLFWSSISLGTLSIVCRLDDDGCDINWYRVLRKVLVATTVSTAVLLVKSLAVNIILLRALSASLCQKSWKHEQDIELLLSLRKKQKHRPFYIQVWATIENIVRSCIGKRLKEFEPDPDHMRDSWERRPGLSFLFTRRRRDRRDDIEEIQRQIIEYLSGSDSGEPFNVDSIVDHWMNYFSIKDQYNVKEILKLYREKAGPKRKRLAEDDIKAILDEDGNGNITRHELTHFTNDIFTTVRNSNRTFRGLISATKSVDRVLDIIVIVIIGLIYGNVTPLSSLLRKLLAR